MNAPARVRLFVAARVPEDRLEGLSRDLTDLRSQVMGARWTRVENQHVTLKFLGSVESEKMTDLAGRCARVAGEHEPAEVSLNALGAFPSERRARVLWAGMEDPTKLLPRLATDLERDFETMGFRTEARVYSPHLTVARFKTPGKLPELPALGPDTMRPFPVQDIVLFRSHLSPKGARYEELERFPL